MQSDEHFVAIGPAITKEGVHIMVPADRTEALERVKAAAKRLRSGESPEVVTDLAYVVGFELLLGKDSEPADFDTSELEITDWMKQYRTCEDEVMRRICNASSS